MIFPLNETFSYKFVLKNNKNMIITNGTPTCSIQNKDTSEFWNGIGWTLDETMLSMDNLGDGIYSYDITFTIPAEYEIHTIEPYYKQEDNFLITVSAGEYALVGEMHMISHAIISGGQYLSGLAPTVSIKRVADNKYLNAEGEFVAGEQALSMAEVGASGVYFYNFTSDESGVFDLRIVEATSATDITRRLTFDENLHESAFVPENYLYEFSSETILGMDGGNSRIKDESSNPVKGAKIEVHNKHTGEVFRALSDDLGKWKVQVKAGTYIMIITHEDFKSTSIERQVG